MRRSFKAIEQTMKALEAPWNGKLVPKDEGYMIRVDGHSFAKYTKPFFKPADRIIHEAMILCTVDLMEMFDAKIGYTFSDEISIAVPPMVPSDPNLLASKRYMLPYKGKMSKMITLASGLTTSKFNQYMQHFQPQVAGNAFFDGRVFTVSEEEVLENLMWRQQDCVRNSKTLLARSYFSTKELCSRSSKQAIDMVVDKVGLDYYDLPKWYGMGTIVKKQCYPKTTINPITQEEIHVMRSNYAISHLPMNTFPVEWMLRKFCDGRNELDQEVDPNMDFSASFTKLLDGKAFLSQPAAHFIDALDIPPAR